MNMLANVDGKSTNSYVIICGNERKFLPKLADTTQIFGGQFLADGRRIFLRSLRSDVGINTFFDAGGERSQNIAYRRFHEMPAGEGYLVSTQQEGGTVPLHTDHEALSNNVITRRTPATARHLSDGAAYW